MTLTLYPAIDMRGGKAVRLLQGDFGRETVYGDDIPAQAARFAAAGARWVHLVDLDGARGGLPVHGEAIAAVAAAGSLRVELGGGIRNDEDVARTLAYGVERIVLGTAAVERPDWVAGLVERYPGRIAIGMDARGGRIATRGWETLSDLTVDAFLDRWNEVGPAAIIFTEISRDGAMSGPDLDALRHVLERSRVPVVASGGVRALSDLKALASLADAGPLDGVIVGRALYEGAFDVATALATLAEAA